MVSGKPRKQRKRLASLPRHLKRKILTAKLSEEAQKQVGVKRLPIRKGDTVIIIRGDNAGTEGKVVQVELKSGRVMMENVTRKKADGTPVYVKVHASKVMLVKVDTSDPWRKKIIERKQEGMNNGQNG